jgi:hypothetical protein
VSSSERQVVEPAEPPRPLAAADRLAASIQDAIRYTSTRKASFMRKSTVVRVGALALSGASTVILGLQDLDFWASLGFALVALSTVAGGIESFFNWRSRWVFAEEAQAYFYQLDDDLKFLLVSKGEAELTIADVRLLFDQYQEIWRRFSSQWTEERRRGAAS